MSLAEQHHITVPDVELLSLAQTLDDLVRFNVFGGALAECYGDVTGSLTWGHFARISDPKIQYTFQSEVNNINDNGASIAQIIADDLDISNLIVIDKGKGSREAAKAKSFKIMQFLEDLGARFSLYSDWDVSQQYREEGIPHLREVFHDAEANPQDVNFNTDDPDLSTKSNPNVERPRLVMEFGSSRGNIATVANDNGKSFEEQAYEELQARFANDYLNCRAGGILVIGSDANQEDSALNAYTHPAHAKFAENIVHRGKTEGALSEEFNPQLLYYDPELDTSHSINGKTFSVVKHDLVASNDQTFGVLQASGDFKEATLKEGDRLTLSHSIKWSPDVMIAAAESQGFKCLAVKWDKEERVPIYVFKAMPKTPVLKYIAA
jgi:hypothetical protein